MRAFRLVRKKYANPLSGEGASRSGNRWNSKGTALIYCADSRAPFSWALAQGLRNGRIGNSG
jgi:RES domain-containing protein